MVLNAKYTILHRSYTGSTDSEGYPTGDDHDDAVQRKAYGWYPLASVLEMSGEYDRRVITSKVLLVPDVSPYAPRDIVILSTDPDGDSYFVSQDVRDYSTGPFASATKGGEIILEKVSG
jgi:hypothetical protein